MTGKSRESGRTAFVQGEIKGLVRRQKAEAAQTRLDAGNLRGIGGHAGRGGG